MTSYPSPDEWRRKLSPSGCFFIILLIGTIILFALGYISWKVVAGLFILVLILIWLMIIREDRVQECAIEWDEEEGEEHYHELPDNDIEWDEEE